MKRLIVFLALVAVACYLLLPDMRSALDPWSGDAVRLWPSLAMTVAAVVAAKLLVAWIAQLVRGANAARDPLRMYDREIRAESFARAGGQCEYTSGLFTRCNSPAEHADHYIPWSRGGATSLKNCVASCSTHNTSKGAKLMTRRATRALERRRRRYFPAGTDVTVGETYREAALSSDVGRR